ncbi:MAG: hypothetical protein DRJ01_16165 [Bacteroidetes bacterium]|nr:MAG: hypothetical protein DRJ01_16165 [Bacteroidota bacterium]
MNLIEIWKQVKQLGITKEMPIYKQKSTMFFNVAMRIYIVFLLVLSGIMFFVKDLTIIPISFIAGIPIIAFSLFLNSKGKVNLSALLMAIIFPIYFIALSIISKSNGEGTEFFFYLFPRFGIIVITLISFVVLGFNNLRKAFLGIIIGILSFVLFDKIHILFNLSIYQTDFEISNLKYVIYIIGALFLFFIVIITFLQRINFQYEKLVVAQKENIEKTHHEISESINYATRLQQTILPDKKLLNKYFSDNFILFKPKDKVSGDFYWWTHVKKHTIITAADCTGHGVPGAFMSMLGVSFLREVVQKKQITNSGEILNKLRTEVIKALKQKGELGEQKDGMDIAIISINHENNIVQFSGANNPLYILTNRELTDFKPLEGFENFYEIKPDKMPIAIYEKMDNFTTHEIQLEKGDILYMFSDGYADQFGGPKGKKFKYKPFKRL